MTRSGTAPQSVCTCSRLRRLTRRMTALYDRELAPTGLRLTQYSLLATLRREGSSTGLAVSELAAAMDMERTTLTRNLRPLVDQGLIAIQADARDTRVRRVVLTDKGVSNLGTAKPYWSVAQKYVAETLGPSNVTALHTWIDQVTPAFRVVPQGD